MKTVRDPDHLLAQGLAAIREQFSVAEGFPPQVLAAAQSAATRAPTDHADRTDMPFVTLDPTRSTDLDQAFAIERAGADLVLHYAIADVAWFVADGDPVDVEAWKRGTTLYLPDGKAGLYPPVLAEQAASLLPDGPRPAVIFTVRIAPDGAATLDGVQRAIIRSRAKLAYSTVQESDLPDGFDDIARRVAAAEERRGAARVDPPEQQVERMADGTFTLRFRPPNRAEQRNAALSLATNLAVADALQAAGTGLFRVMAQPEPRAETRLRRTAEAFGLAWASGVPLTAFEKTLDPADARHAAFMFAVRRAGQGASYQPFIPGTPPWHAAVAAPYAHATAPLRRLADRYVIRAALALAAGQRVEQVVEDAFQRLPAVMQRAEARGGQIDRAVIDLAEASFLASRIGSTFDAVVTDLAENGARIQLCDPAVVARVKADGVLPGTRLAVRLVAADPARRTMTFERAA